MADLYEVSDQGRIRRIKTPHGDPMLRLLKPSVNVHGYCIVALSGHGVLLQSQKIHRLVAAAFLGPIPTGKVVNHLNGIKTDNHLTNLEVVTPSQNMFHSARVLGKKGGKVWGSQHPNSKLKEVDIPVIRALLAAKMPIKHIAKLFRVGHSAIHAIYQQKAWRHVPCLFNPTRLLVP